MFPLVANLVGGVDMPMEAASDVDDLCLLADRDEPRRQTPDTAALLELANVTAPSDGTTRAAVMKAMRKAAEKRIAGVTEHKRRRYHGHAASLALACADIDGSAETASWLVALVDEYRRYPALQRALGQRGARR